MNEKAYPKWVGVLLGFLISGVAHYLSGDRTAGVKWYLGLTLGGIAASLIVAVPGTVTYVCAAALLLLCVVLWFVMMKQSYRPVRRIGLLGWIAVIALSVVLGLVEKLVTRQLIHPFRTPTEAMSPTIAPGDHLMVERISHRLGKLKRGDVAVFSTAGITHSAVRQEAYYVKRIAGLPGETVQIKPPHLLVNGSVVDEPAIIRDISGAQNGYEGFLLAHKNAKVEAVLTKPDDSIVLGEDEYFLLGDNTAHSLDSRYFGPVSGKHIVGRATRIYYPFKRINALR